MVIESLELALPHGHFRAPRRPAEHVLVGRPHETALQLRRHVLAVADDEVRQQFTIKDVYNFRNRNYLLRKLENHDRKEAVDVESYTIEHIMPQNENVSSEWQQELGENWQETHAMYLPMKGCRSLGQTWLRSDGCGGAQQLAQRGDPVPSPA